MPYNTRRKSLNLSTLGIQLPATSRAHAHRHSLSKSGSSNVPAEPTTAAASPPTAHPSKRVKHSHSPSHSTPAGATSPRSPPSWSPSAAAAATTTTTTTHAKPGAGFAADRPRSSGTNGRTKAYQHTPPPSPGAADGPGRPIDWAGMHDDIVAGVAEQLETTGNRPHLIKELAAVLSRTNDSVAGSANPAALLSSRLAAYMKRPGWTAAAPCPVAKELIPVHPRKVFYYLTTRPRQPLPAHATEPPPLATNMSAGSSTAGQQQHKRVISPSLSDASQDGDDDRSASAHSAPNRGPTRNRRDLSPSPEIDLSLDLDGGAPPPLLGPDAPAPDFPTPATPASITPASGPFGPFGRGAARTAPASLASEGSAPASGGASGGAASVDLGLGLPAHHRRAESPPLEGDEREFTATARGMRLRGMSLDAAAPGGAARAVDAALTPALAPAGPVVVKTEPGSAVAGAVERAGSAAPSLPELDDERHTAAAALFGGVGAPLAPRAASAEPLSSPLVRPVAGLAAASPRLLPAVASPRLLPAAVTTAALAPKLQTGTALVAQQPRDVQARDADGDTVMLSPSVLGDSVYGLGWDVRRPEHVDLEELNDLLDTC